MRVKPSFAVSKKTGEAHPTGASRSRAATGTYATTTLIIDAREDERAFRVLGIGWALVLALFHHALPRSETVGNAS